MHRFNFLDLLRSTPLPSRTDRQLAGIFAALALAAMAATSPARAQAAPADGICRVAPAAAGAATGADWANPMALDDALALGGCHEIWALHGTYKPTREMQLGDPRTKAFDIGRPLKLYGGFAGTEASLAARVLTPALPTVLSGDLAGNDAAGLQGNALRTHSSRGDNSYHVVVLGGVSTVAYTAANTVLDGLSITAGNATGTYPHERGGGLLCNSNTCSPTISNATFSGNSANNSGGAIYNNDSSSPTISNATFSGNSAYNGGAIHNNPYSSPTISNATFSGNSAGSGGAIYNNNRSTPNISNAIFSDNSAGNGGAIYNAVASSTTISNATFSGNSADNGGAIYSLSGINSNSNSNSNPTISNATFSDNSASSNGGAIYNYSSSPTISNATFSGNSANDSGGAIYNYSYSSPTITASILWGNTAPGSPQIFRYASNSNPTVSHSIVQNGWTGAGTGNSDQDPLLSAPADHGGPTQTLLPAANSPAVSPGYDCSAVNPAPTTDQRGVARPTTGNGCHIGAVQRLLTPAALTVTTSGTGSGTVSSSPAGIQACTTHSTPSGVCSASFGDAANPSTGTSVTLTATPQAGSRFTGWLGTGASACSSASSTCTLVMDAAKTIEARFGLLTSDVVSTPSGNINVALAGAQCTFSNGPNHTAAPTSGVPAGYSALPYGQIGFSAHNCTHGGSLTITLTLPSAPAPNTRLLKWNGSTWQAWPATFSGNTVTYTVTDHTGTASSFTGDTNATAGVIDDPVMLAVLSAGSAVAIPTLSQWGLLITSLLLAALAAGHHLRRQHGQRRTR